MNATPAILQLTDSLPRVWRSPDELQFGLDRPALVLRHVTNLEERLIAALDAGVTRAGLTMLARRAGGKDAQVTELLERLRPVLGRPPRPSGPPRPGNVAVAGGGPVGDLVAHLLRTAGHEPVVMPDDTDAGAAGSQGGRIRLAVIVADYVVRPSVAAYWLRRDITHLPVVFGDGQVRVGPVVRPGAGPCVRCLQLAEADADAAWPAIAAQLAGSVSPLHEPGLDFDVAALVAAVARGRAGAQVDAWHSVVLSPPDDTRANGDVTRQAHRVHPRCGCRFLPESGRAPAPTVAPPRRTS